jgi:hypothetical protein
MGNRSIILRQTILLELIISLSIRTTIMPYASVIPHDDASKLMLLQQLNSQLLNYAVALEISNEDLAQLKTGLEWFDYSLKTQDAIKNYGNALVNLKRILRDGPKDTAISLPLAPQLATPPAEEPYADIFGFLGSLITRIKKHKNYTVAIGKTLKIIAPQIQPIDYSSLQPVLSVDFQGGQPVLHWKNNPTDAIELEADHGSGSFSLLTIQLTPDYQDNTPLPAAGSAVVWKYRAIFHLRDARVGHWSQVLEVGVKG